MTLDERDVTSDLLFFRDIVTKNENPISNDITHHDAYETLGFKIEEIKLDGNCIIFCYKN